MTINELRTKRAKLWEGTKAFLESHRNENGVLSVEDDASYSKMEQEITDLGREISRMERQEALDAELAMPVTAPLTARPETAPVPEKQGRASDAYKKAFWAAARTRDGILPEVRNTLVEGTDSEGGYLVPDEYEHTLVSALENEGVIRKHAHVITTNNGLHKIPIVASKGTATWLDEAGAFTEDDDTFGAVQLDAHKVGCIIKVSQELLQDSAFDLERYFTDEFTRRISAKEEAAFIIGDGSKKPTGLLNATGGAPVGVTTASATAITADELIDLYHSLKTPYRKNAIWIFTDSTLKAIRKLKDGEGQYLWRPGLADGTPDTILGRPYFTSDDVPAIASGAKTVIFGDLNYYWIGDRQGVTFQRLNERYADQGQIGFLATKRLDGKLVLSEAVKVLQQKA